MEENKVSESGCSGECPCGSSMDSVSSSSSARPVPITSMRNPGVVPSSSAGRTPATPGITVIVSPTTGGQFELQVDCRDSIEQLKKTISKRFRVAKERICLLHREKDLREGSLRDNSIQDGSKITLLPMVETGLLAQRPEQTVLQALENLSDTQVNDFLSGRAPLNLTMRLGDHLMFIQLQLSTVGGQALSSAGGQQSSHHRRSTAAHRHHHHHHSSSSRASTSGSTTSTSQVSSSAASSSSKSHPAPSSRTQPPPPTPVPRDSRSSRPPALLVASPAAPALGGAVCSACTASSSSEARRGTLQGSCRPSTSATTTPVLNSAVSSTPADVPSATLIPAAGVCNEMCTGTGQPVSDVTHLLDTRTLAEASRNLSQTLRHLSSKALNVRGAEVKDCPHNCSAVRRQGAIIESMHHHGRGVYSGTFSGTLNPALQDRNGHPKRDISTIVHILNDLLGATPQYRRHGARHSLEITGGSSSQQTGTGRTVASSISTEEFNQENQATRGKMEQLQLMMEERRARRRARRETRAPYPAVETGSPSASGTSSGVALCSVSGDLSLCSSSDPLGTTTATSDHLPATTATCSAVRALTSSLTGTSGAAAADPNNSTAAATDSVSTIAVDPAEAKSNDEAVPMDCADSSDSALDTSGATNEYLKLNPETVVA